ncbi:MAG: LruC domain-containing protein [Bacteroidales bacterium]|nr:LruC domain-containing protein [Bacteroidales bacterium]
MLQFTHQSILKYTAAFFLLFSIISFSGCRKTTDENITSNPSKFTDLKIDPNFEFQSSVDLSVTIKAPGSGTTSLKVIEIFLGNPASGGKLISKGATDNNATYQTQIRIPSTVKELYLGKLSSDGNNQYVSVPVSGTTLLYDFSKPAQLKSQKAVLNGPDCNTGCTQTINGNVGNLTISSGQTCILSGTSAIINNLTINDGAILMICGNVTIGSINSWSASTITITSTGILNYTNMSYGNGLHIESYGIVNTSGININSGGFFHSYPGATTTVSGSVNNGGSFINDGTLNLSGTFNNNGGNVTLQNTGTMIVGNGLNNNSTMLNSGTLTINNNKLNINGGSSLNNSGTLTINNDMINMALTTNSGTLTINGSLTNNGGSTITNACKILVAGNFSQMGTINNNSYIKVAGTSSGSTGTTNVNGGAVINLGQQAFLDTKNLTMNGTINGSNTASSRISISNTTNIGWGASVTNYVDLCDVNGIESNHGTIGPNVTYCTYQIIPTACNPGTGTAPLITSALTATGTVGVQFSYQITASGSTPITFSVTGLPSGLSFSGSTIAGSPLQSGTFNVTLTAQSYFGTDSKTLVLTIGGGGTAPVITSQTTASGIKNQPFSYTITASGTNPITYSASPLPAGLQLSDNTISGIPTATGLFNITMTATNNVGQDSKTLDLTITAPVGPTDTDGDGVPDDLDAYPTDPTRAFNSFYPNEVDFGTLVYEDLWPSYGDYDFNDLVVNFQYKTVTNAQNKVVDIIAKFKIKAGGASLNNGFGLVLNTPPANISEVIGCVKMGTAVTLDPKGFEAGHTNETVIIPFDAVNTIMGGGMFNTIHGGFTVQPSLQTVTIHFASTQLPATIGYPPYNPFMFVNQDRGKEIHLKDNPPTELVNPVYFHVSDDASNPSQGFYYRSNSGLPWAIEIPVDFDYPLEKADILTAYVHFAAWAQSSGSNYPDWYMNNPGYRNQANIY